MDRSKALFQQHPCLTIGLALLLLIGIGLIFDAQSIGVSNTNKPSYSTPTSTGRNYKTYGIQFGLKIDKYWKPAYKLLFANRKGVVNYEYSVSKCAKTYKIVDSYKKGHYVKYGKFKKFVRVIERKKKFAGYICQLKDWRGESGQENTISTNLDWVFAIKDFTGVDGYVGDKTPSTDLPTQWQILWKK